MFSSVKDNHLYLIHFRTVILEVALSQMERRGSIQRGRVTLHSMDSQ